MKMFMGVIEDVNDPLKVNRARVRVIGVHPESKSEVATGDLPWSPVLSSTAMMSAPLLNPGDWVVGVFIDGDDCQQPVIIGSFVSIPTNNASPNKGFNDPTGVFPVRIQEGTNSRAARHQKIDDQTQIGQRSINRIKKVTKADGSTWEEPLTKYNAAYPANKVIETNSGHLIEFDDTPGSERIHFYHRSGAFTEMFPNGDVVHKAAGDEYSLTMGSKNVYASGNVNISVYGSANVNANGGITLGSKDKDIRLSAKNIIIEADEQLLMNGVKGVTINAKNGQLTTSSKGMALQSTTGATVAAAEKINLKGKAVTVSKKLVLAPSKFSPPSPEGMNVSRRPIAATEKHTHTKQDRVDRYRVVPDSTAVQPPPNGSWPSLPGAVQLPTPLIQPTEVPTMPQDIPPTPPDIECGTAPVNTSPLYKQVGSGGWTLSTFTSHDAYTKGVALIKEFEGFEEVAYSDAVGVATIGWGFTKVALDSVKNKPEVSTLAFWQNYDGQIVVGSTRMSRSDADAILDAVLKSNYIPAVLGSTSGLQGARVTPYMIAAVMSFTFNLGAGNLQKSTLRKLLLQTTAATTAETYNTIALEFAKWNKAGGQVLAGLTRRRGREKCLFLFGG